MHFLVAQEVKEGAEAEMVGFASWKEEGENEEPEYNSEIPESANGALIVYLIREIEAHKKGLGVQGLANSFYFSLLSFTEDNQNCRAGILRCCARTSDGGSWSWFAESCSRGGG
jgi:hypothetical protein